MTVGRWTAVIALGLAFPTPARADENEDRKDETAAPVTPPLAPAPAGTVSVAEPPPPKKKYDDQEYDEPWVTGTARLADRFYEGGPFMGAGGPLAVDGLVNSVGLSGVRVLENHGYLSKFTIAMLMAMGQRNSAYVGSSYHKDTAGNTWRTDYYRPLSPAERQANARAMQAAISSEYLMELVAYSPSLAIGKQDDRAYAKGFEFYLGGEFPIGKAEGTNLPTIMQIAFAASHISANNASFRPGEGPQTFQQVPYARDLRYSNVGVMIRTIFPITTWAEAYLHWDLNILTLFYKGSHRESGYVWTSPLRAGLNFNVTDRAYFRAHGSINGLGSYGIGWASEIGVRF
jgi:hypothetical protein